jgi:nucleoside-diphosphate-sugar epimerase
MKILITGAAGYIGSELVNHLIGDHKITAFDNMMYDRTSLLRYATHPNFTFIKGDVRDTNTLLKLVSQHDVIIPLAALVGFPLCDQDPRAATEINLASNRFIASNKSQDQILLYPCTNSGYGVAKDGVCTEESPLNPVSLYGKTKVQAEEIYRNTSGCTTFRLATVFGPSSRMRSDLLVNNFVLRALQDRLIVLYECEFMRNYVHIQDVCRAFRYAIDNWDVFKDQTYNLGNDALNMNKLQLAQNINEHIPLEIIRAEFNSDPDVRDYIVSSQKIYDTGFVCQYDLHKGVKQLINAYSLIQEPWYGNY